jgi:2-(1,2-epoxy-1,2-dihydrophenyl)acetyl-CoA isomerase
VPTSPNTITTAIVDDVAEIVLTRPDKLNAVNVEMASELRVAIGAVEAAGARALIVRGEGRGFCAGRDLSEAEPLSEDAEAILRDVFNPLVSELAELPIPTFAAVHGPALGVGLGLALACDVVVVADDSKLGSPFAGIGCVLDSGGHRHLVQRLGPHRALELIFTGRLLSGREAAEFGLVNRSVAPDDLLPTVREMAARCAHGPTTAFRLSKALVRRIDREHLGLADVLAAEAQAQGAASRTHDYAEGISAFQHRRQPNFRGS